MIRRVWESYNLWLNKRRLRRNIATARSAMMSLGYSVGHLSDEEFIAGCERIAEAAAQTGVTLAEVAIAFAALEQEERKWQQLKTKYERI